MQEGKWVLMIVVVIENEEFLTQLVGSAKEKLLFNPIC
jgi:hypothetical protein